MFTMKKKTFLAMICTLLLIGCSNNTAVTESTAGDSSADASEQTAENAEPEANDAMSDGVIDYKDEFFSIKLNKVELGQDNTGRDVLFAYFQFENNTGEIKMPMECVGIEYFQNGQQISKGVTQWSSDQMKALETDSWAKTMDGSSVEFVDYIDLTDTSSPVTIMIQYKYMIGNKDILFKEVDQEEVDLQ